jgi:HSP20 family protein
MEQSYGSFYRRLALPFETTAEQIKATYAEGVLEIHIPKPTAAPTTAPKPITIV